MAQVIRNAADRQLQDVMARQQRQRREQLDSDVRDVLRTPGGRRVFQTMLDDLQPRTRLWDGSSRIHSNAARYDVGTQIKDMIDAADPDALPLMLREEHELRKRELAEVEAAAARKRKRNRAPETPEADVDGEGEDIDG